jgi:hypothetical protein
VIVLPPAANELVMNEATPEAATDAVPNTVAPSKNVTVPVGAGALPEAGLTVAVNVTFAPSVTVVLVGAVGFADTEMGAVACVMLNVPATKPNV